MKIDPHWMEQFKAWRQTGGEGSAPGLAEAIEAYMSLFEEFGVEHGDHGALAFKLALRHGYLTKHLRDKGGHPKKDCLTDAAQWYAVEIARQRRDGSLHSISRGCEIAGVSRSQYYAALNTPIVEMFERNRDNARHFSIALEMLGPHLEQAWEHMRKKKMGAGLKKVSR